MRKIPIKLRNELSKKPYYHKCCFTGFTRFKIDWHHCFTYAGKQINEEWNILPVWEKMHSAYGRPDSIHNCKRTRELAELKALRRATPDVFKRYAKANFDKILIRLEKKYANE